MLENLYRFVLENTCLKFQRYVFACPCYKCLQHGRVMSYSGLQQLNRCHRSICPNTARSCHRRGLGYQNTSSADFAPPALSFSFPIPVTSTWTLSTLPPHLLLTYLHQQSTKKQWGQEGAGSMLSQYADGHLL